MAKEKTKKELAQEIKDLEERINELETTTDIQADRMSVINEVMSILNELPLGHALVNRAKNRSKLRYLRHVVLPRRQKQLLKIQADKSIPEPIKEILTNDEIDLLVKAKRALHHREEFEHESAHKVRDAFMRLQKFLTERFVTKKQLDRTLRQIPNKP